MLDANRFPLEDEAAVDERGTLRRRILTRHHRAEQFIDRAGQGVLRWQDGFEQIQRMLDCSWLHIRTQDDVTDLAYGLLSR